MPRASHLLSRFNVCLAHLMAWCVVAMALLTGAVVLLRALFDFGSIALQESITYLHAAVFMLCMAYAADCDAHVRVDIFYRRFDGLARAWVNALGALLFLLPLALFLLAVSWRFVTEAWAIREGSIDPGGIPAVYVLKTLIPIAGLLLALRALGEIGHNLLLLCGRGSTETSSHG